MPAENPDRSRGQRRRYQLLPARTPMLLNLDYHRLRPGPIALELDFHAGFSVLTGETGAGKSILLDALSLVLGERAEAGVVRGRHAARRGGGRVSLEGLIELAAWLEENDLAGERASFSCAG